jgi:flagellar protein FlbD
MIKLTSIGGNEFYLNNDLIYKIENLPDTIITLTDGKKIRVSNSVEEIIQEIINFKRKIYHTGVEASTS